MLLRHGVATSRTRPDTMSAAAAAMAGPSSGTRRRSDRRASTTPTTSAEATSSLKMLESCSSLQLDVLAHRRGRRRRSASPHLRSQLLFLSTALLLFAITHLPLRSLAVDFTFTWPTPSYQCYPLTMTWQGGTPPYQAIIAPALQLPFVYKIPANACAANGQCSYTIDMQLNSGFQYVLMLGDANGVGTGGSTALNYVQGYQHSECLATVAQNASSLNTSVMVFAPNVVQCESSFSMEWDEGAIQPNNFTVISTDQTFDPFDVTIPTDLPSLSYNWTVAVPAGHQFMIMWNTLFGYGHGGVSGLYRVNATATGSGTECLPTQPATKPTSTTTMPTDVSTSPVTPTQTSTDGSGPASTSSPQQGGGISTAAVTVIAVIGAAIGIAIAGIIAFCFFVVRRRRRNALERQGRDRGGDSKYVAVGSSSAGGGRHVGNNGALHEVDLMDGASSIISPTSARGGGNEGNVPSSRAYRAVASGTLTPFGTEDGFGGGMSPTVASSTSPGFAGFGAAAAASIDADRKWQSSTTSHRPSAGHAPTGIESDFVDSPMTTTNPFDASPLNAEDAAAALALRGRDGRRPSDISSPSSLSAYELQDQNWQNYQQRQRSGPGTAATAMTRTKSQEAAEELIDVDSSQDRVESATRVGAPALPPQSGGGGGGGFRITNASDRDPADLARHTPPPPSSQQASINSGGVPTIAAPTRRTAGQRAAYQQPRFVRHADAGRVDNHRPPQQEEEVIDLPPLYTDLVREENDDDDDHRERRAATTSPRSDGGI